MALSSSPLKRAEMIAPTVRLSMARCCLAVALCSRRLANSASRLHSGEQYKGKRPGPVWAGTGLLPQWRQRQRTFIFITLLPFIELSQGRFVTLKKQWTFIILLKVYVILVTWNLYSNRDYLPLAQPRCGCFDRQRMGEGLAKRTDPPSKETGAG